MRRAFIVVMVVTLAAAAVRAQADILAKLGSNTQEAHEAFFSSLAEGSVSMAGTAAVFKAAAPEARAAMVTSVVNLARAYAGTADFTRRWMTFREQHKPSAHEALPSMAEMQAMQRLLQSAERPMVVFGGTGWDAAACHALRAWVESAHLPAAAAYRCQDRLDNRSSSYVEIGRAHV